MINTLITYFGASCSGGSFLGFPTWYHYLPGKTVNGMCSPQLNSLTDIWLVVAAVIEILLRVAGMVAVIFIIIGAISYITSQGQPEKTAKARDTIVNSLIGLAIAISSAAVVGFIAGRIT